MVTNKRKKVGKYRAHTTHGGGHRKKRRGAGNRGGRGNAGSGKKGKAKKPSSEKLGRKGFSSKIQNKLAIMNIADLEKMTKNEKGVIELPNTKLLGKGQLNSKILVKVKLFSKKAEEKITKAGGEILADKKEE